ncbi:MAG: amidohydrolase family protein [Verrucomicrobia bacterium]|nr:amidohydrolase family protein [Verrucomicrobiota bacterium]
MNSPPRDEELMQAAAANGIDLLIISCLGDWTDFPDEATVRAANEQSDRFARKFPGRVRWLAYLNPQLNNWRVELEQSLAAGACGVKLWISLKDSSGRLAHTEQVLETASAAGLPVLLHVYNRTDGNRPGEISIQEFVRLSKQYPDCTMVAAHGGGNWRQSLKMLQDAGPKACMDISGGFPEFGMLDVLLETDGVDRILFGSDAPGRGFSSQMAKVTFSGLSKTDREKVLWKNAARVFGIDPKSVPGKLASQPAPLRDLPDFSEEHFCFCGTWPFFKSACPTPRQLQDIFEQNQIKTGFTADLTGMFHIDLLTANADFLKACEPYDRIKPLAVLNPSTYNWEIAVREAASGKFAGGFISPYLHHWQINADAHRKFFELCAELKLKLWVNCSSSDHRFRHLSFDPRPATSEEIMEFIRRSPPNQYVFQGLPPGSVGAALKEFGSKKQIFFELSQFTDSQFALDAFLAKHGSGHLVMGSEFPFRHFSETRQAARLL